MPIFDRGRGGGHVAWVLPMLFVALLFIFGAPARAGVLSREELAAKFSPPFALGERDATLPVYPVLRTEGTQDRLVAYVFETTDLAPVPGFSGTPPNLLIVLGADGTFQRVAVISQHEPRSEEHTSELQSH